MLAGWLIVWLGLGAGAGQSVGPGEPFRPPAVPLVTHDPYFSVWSFGDRLTDDWTRHWTGAVQALIGMVWIDQRAYRFAGPEPEAVSAMQQRRLEVLPTRTIYEFSAGGVNLTLTFLSPLLPEDPDLLSRSITYLTLVAMSEDGKEHNLRLYLDCSAEWAVNTPDQVVGWSRARSGGLHVLRVGTQAQSVLGKCGDNLRIDWGHFYLAVEDRPATAVVIAGHRAARQRFAQTGRLPDSDDLRQPRPANDDWPVLACTVDLGQVGRQPVSTTIYLVYDDLYSIEYFKRPLRPYWRRGAAELADILAAAVGKAGEIGRRCAEFDTELMADLEAVGGRRYARLAALAFRQTIAAHKLAADFDGTMLMFPKENFSNGCIGTVDVIFPSSPFFLLFNPRLLEAQLRPVLTYADSPRWPFPFAPHDLGTYPWANGQVYGGGERSEENQMPVEESANLLILLAALAELDREASFANQWWPLISRWAEYLREKGLDPENQLCTDDFTGHLAHNANLSIKAIIAIGAYARLCELTGRQPEATSSRALAEQFAAQWMKLAEDGDHYRLAFDRPGTWSLKYNLLWDRVLGLSLFPPQVAARELAFYQTRLNRFGVPLDGRETYAKLDFSAWAAALAERPADFQALMNPLYESAHVTPDRVPLTDWYRTTDARCVGFRARSVVGGLYAPLLLDRDRWVKWARRAARHDSLQTRERKPQDASH